ncbi:lectin subunit alpha-like [Calliphora vicina]|uniref:lectin subunit alpha-like n=1 Tax=Calliphora vicina TaxID=7373 RepID=UPI00325B4DBD
MKTLHSIAHGFLVCFVLFEAVTSTPQLHKASDGREYLIETDLKYNWYQAYHECARKDSQLVVIDTAEKNNAIIELLKKVVGKSSNLWLGGNDEYSSSRDFKRSFFWSPTGKEFSFSFWSDKNPDNYRHREHCVHIWDLKPLYQWNDNDCTRDMGFICEENHYLESYNKDLKNKCNAVKRTSSAISNDFDQTQKQQISEINKKLQNFESVGDGWKIEVQQLHNSTQTAIQKIFDEQQITVQQLTEKMVKQVHELNAQLKKSTTDISAQFAKKLKVKQSEINKIC